MLIPFQSLAERHRPAKPIRTTDPDAEETKQQLMTTIRVIRIRIDVSAAAFLYIEILGDGVYNDTVNYCQGGYIYGTQYLRREYAHHQAYAAK